MLTAVSYLAYCLLCLLVIASAWAVIEARQLREERKALRQLREVAKLQARHLEDATRELQHTRAGLILKHDDRNLTTAGK